NVETTVEDAEWLGARAAGLKLDESGNARTFAMNWRPLHAARTKGPKPLLATGKNRIEFEIQFLGAGSAKVQIEVKAAGEAEPAAGRSY
ncbi:MAG: hypothetical protein WCS31_12520, partial [Verrucomicrobiae bacterium]